MNNIDIEYAIKKDVRNNPIVREADARQRQEFVRTAAAWALIVSMALLAAWQHFEILRHGYQIEKLQHERAEEEAINRRLRLMIETLRSPDRIEHIAMSDLHMVVPPAGSTLVIERVAPSTADKSVVASAGAPIGLARRHAPGGIVR
jgi:cell division protein FtsL